MKKRLAKIMTVMSMATFTYMIVPAQNALGASGLSDGINKTKTGENDVTLGTAIGTITNILFFVIGAVSVIMIIIGGLKYVTSNGDSGAVTSAKNTILYAVIGIIVALLGYAIVNFVVGEF